MKFCKKCVQPDTRPDVIFNENGVCYPCEYHATLDQINWADRKKELLEIAKWGKEHCKSNYDCIVAVSGGKDSTRQSMYVRDELGLRPLLVSCTYPPEQQTEVGAHNLANLIQLGFDTISIGPAPETWKELMKQGFLRFGNWCRSTEMALYAVTPKVAVAYNIPLVFLGENPSLTWGCYGGSLDGDGNKMKYNHTLGGGDPTPLLSEGITKKDVFWYTYPSDHEMERTNLRIVYLGYYIKDFNSYANGEFAIKHGLWIRKGDPIDTGSLNGFDACDEDFVIINQMLKYVKFGFGKVNDQVCEAIRIGRLNRKEGIELVKKYDGKCHHRYIEKLCQYMNISEEEFWNVIESYRNKDIWERDERGQWKMKFGYES